MKEYELKFTEEMQDWLRNCLKNKRDNGDYWIDENLVLDNRFKGIIFTVFKDPSIKNKEDSIILTMVNKKDDGWNERIGIYCVGDKVFFSNNKPELAKSYFDRLFEKLYLKDSLSIGLSENSNQQSKKRFKI